MSGFIALKAITLGSVTYPEGAAISEEAVVPKRVPALIRLKRIARVGDSDTSSDTATAVPPSPQGEGRVSIPILRGESVLLLQMEPEDVALAVELVQRNAKDAAKAIEAVTNGDVLILVDTLDQRKTVKDAAKAQAGKLEAGKNAGDEGAPSQSGDSSLAEGDKAEGTSSAPDGAPSPQGEGKGDGEG